MEEIIFKANLKQYQELKEKGYVTLWSGEGLISMVKQ